ncbi:MAG: hypothetical protein M3R27_11820 [Bacteroidota bacterium]|nr:hypothetical protein [Bacteroidota bacterium]
MIKLNKINCFLLGLGFIFIFYFINRLDYIIGSEKASGKLIGYLLDDEGEQHRYFPIVEYTWKDKVYRCRGRENAAIAEKKEIPVLLENGDPYQPVIFTLGSFWLYPLFYALLPIVLWAAFSLSYVGKGEHLMIGWKYPFVKKKRVGFIEGNDHLKIT